MTTPPTGSWGYTYDASSHAIPVTAGNLTVDYSTGWSIVGDQLRGVAAAYPNYPSLTWSPGTGGRSVAMDVFDCVDTADVFVGHGADIILSHGNYIAGIVIADDGILYYPDLITPVMLHPITWDGSTPHRVMARMTSASTEFYVDGSTYTHPSLDLGAPYNVLGVSNYGTVDWGMFAFSTALEDFALGAGPPLPTSISLGGNGIAFDLDEFALYGAPLTTDQIHILDAAGRGVPR